MGGKKKTISTPLDYTQNQKQPPEITNNEYE